MDVIHWAVIGAGRFGAIHARTIESLPGCQLSAICNRNPERLAAAATHFPAARPVTDYREVLDDPSIDAVSITTHWRDHFRVAMDALASGKHVLLEKPMAATADECRRLVEAADCASGIFLVGHICRFDPRVASARDAIQEGRIGRIVSLHARRNLPQAPGNIRLDKISPLMGDGIHDADLMMWFLGRAPSRLYARNVRANRFEYPDLGWAMFEFDDDAVGVVETVWCLPETTPTVIDARMEVIGTKGKLEIDCATTGLTVTDDRCVRSVDTDYWPLVHGIPAGVLRFELEYFAQCVRRNEQPTIITPREAARAVAVMQRAEESAASGQVLAYNDD